MIEQGAQLTNLDMEAGSEWRFELEDGENIAVRSLTSDPLFINSQEIPPSSWYPIHRLTKSSIYAPSPSRIQLTSIPSSQYTSTSTTQPQLINIHLALERLRILAKRGHEGIVGPRMMVMGPLSSGKSTVVKNLVNMALGTGLGWTPGVVGLDPSSPPNLIPGTLSLSSPSHPLPTHHLAHPLGSPPTSQPANTLSADVETVGWWLGALEPTTKNSDVWKVLVDNIAEGWRKRCEQDKKANASGLFVDTPAAFCVPTLGTKKDDPKARYVLVNHAIQALNIDTILVIGHEKLHIDIIRLPLIQSRGIQVIRIPKSGGAVDLDEHYREAAHRFQIRAYFYGEPTLPPEISSLVGKMVGLDPALTPYSSQISWKKLIILRVGEENAAPSTALPLGSAKVLSPTRLTRVDPSGEGHVVRLLNKVLALVKIENEDRIVPTVKEEKQEGQQSEEEATSKDGEEGNGGERTEEEGEGEVTRTEEQKEESLDEEDEVPFKEEIGTREVMGYIVITAIDTFQQKYTVLSPNPGKLPSTIAIAGSIEWVDST
ncbi:mRNA cleavage and polyadenylation factor Clp1 [Cryptococcus depauperatus CBS 7841]|uniref:Polynucleotide 5'-hydroxyl-kinase GRC3 n=1 Tax=Cryptococcus depauperatus CBS 7841 TaxID=1295531 RepID=A0AAJ8JXI6_9TREE